MSGHNKWKQIKDKKAKTDQGRAQLFSKLANAIAIAARGNPDPKFNATLRSAVEQAHKHNLPQANIERAIHRAAEVGSLEELLIEAYGPEGIGIIIEAITDNRNRTVSDVRHAFTRCGGNLGENGCVAWMFERKGRLEISVEGLTDDAMMEHVLESSAEDYFREGDVYVVTCSTEDFGRVTDYFKSNHLKPHNADLVLVPKTTVQVADEKSAGQILRLLDTLDDLDDVQKVSCNFEMDEVLMEKVAG